MEQSWQQAIDSLTARLQLGSVSPFTQDWECEVGKPNDLPVYQDLYESGSLTEMEKKVLMRLILEHLEGATKRTEIVTDDLLERVAGAIVADYPLHNITLDLWALPDEERDDPEHVYRITPFVRKIMSSHERISK